MRHFELDRHHIHNNLNSLPLPYSDNQSETIVHMFHILTNLFLHPHPHNRHRYGKLPSNLFYYHHYYYYSYSYYYCLFIFYYCVDLLTCSCLFHCMKFVSFFVIFHKLTFDNSWTIISKMKILFDEWFSIRSSIIFIIIGYFIISNFI